MNPLRDTQRTPYNPIILVDDEKTALQLMEMNLRSAGYNNIIAFNSSSQAQQWILENECDALVLDIIMPDLSGLKMLEEIQRAARNTPIIMATGVDDLNTAVICMKKGAYDYIVKPIESERFIASVNNAVQLCTLQRNYTRLSQSFLSDTLENPSLFTSIRTRNPRMLAAFRYIEAVAINRYPILLTGETGSGKELFAQAIHTASGATGRFVAINIAGLDDNSFSDSLFGHVKGAFTGADSVRAGFIVNADGGTLFLDEIGELGQSSQVKLLRLLQENEYFSLGCDTPKQSHCRIVAATNRSINDLALASDFRNDLYYRLTTHHIAIPPLRDRKEDLPLLIESFIETSAQEKGIKAPSYPKELIDLLSTYSFPGNVRELQAMVRNAIALHKSGTLSLDSFREAIGIHQKNTSAGPVKKPAGIIFSDNLPTLNETQDSLVREAMTRANGNQSVAAQLLGITRQSLGYRLKKLSNH
ncbi:MAG: sigma-54-dependent Fis family transcriptional regulator [Chitinispirillaceae bacterium]|nr:sigma-54-dependent Fis family transcriptional regulator [Chitinispirillaceae bacterium]